jgi:hypothetical protein
LHAGGGKIENHLFSRDGKMVYSINRNQLKNYIHWMILDTKALGEWRGDVVNFNSISADGEICAYSDRKIFCVRPQTGDVVDLLTFPDSVQVRQCYRDDEGAIVTLLNREDSFGFYWLQCVSFTRREFREKKSDVSELGRNVRSKLLSLGSDWIVCSYGEEEKEGSFIVDHIKGDNLSHVSRRRLKVGQPPFDACALLDRRILCTAGSKNTPEGKVEGFVAFIDLSSGEILYSEIVKYGVISVVASPTENVVATIESSEGGRDGALRLWKVDWKKGD